VLGVLNSLLLLSLIINFLINFLCLRKLPPFGDFRSKWVFNNIGLVDFSPIRIRTTFGGKVRD
jgi:hypothetical protein